MKPSWIIPFFLGQVILGHSPAASKKKGKQDTRRIKTEGFKYFLGKYFEKADWNAGMASSGLGMSPATAGTWVGTKEASVLVTQLEERRHLGGGFYFLPLLHVYKKLL